MVTGFHQITPYFWVKQNDPYATNTGLLLRAGQACLIDPGISSDNLTEIKHFVATQDAEVNTIILTHAHWDHLLGAAWFPGAFVVAHQVYLEVIRDHGAHLAQQVASWKASAGHAPGVWHPPLPTTVFSQELELHTAGIPLHLIHAPGHTADHMAVYLAESKFLWAGDMLSDLELPLVEDVNAYIRTLAALEALDANILVPGHGAPVLESADVAARFNQDRIYLYKLRQCVQGALAQGCDCAQTVETCFSVPFSQPDDYPNAHLWNIESAYRTLGGTVESPSGWDNEW